MNEGKAVKETEKINTLKSLIEDLKKLGLEKGDTVLVHASLSKLGWTCGGSQTVIMALLELIGTQGTIVMPAHTSANSDPAEWENPPVPKEWVYDIYLNMPAFDVNLSPTRGMGCIAELFRTLPQALRSNHPNVSFSALGKNEKYITEEHILAPQFGLQTPLGKLYNLKAKVLLLGVAYDSCTSFHLAEVLTEKLPFKKMGTAMMEDNKRVWKWFQDLEYDSEADFEKIGSELDKTGLVNIDRVGSSLSRVFPMQQGVDFAKNWLLENRFKIQS